MSLIVIADRSFTAAAIRVAEGATRSMLIVQYLFILDQTASHPAPRIAAALLAAADRGVKVRILLNRFMHTTKPGGRPRNPPLELRHPNIDLRFHTSGMVLHSKVIVADAETVLTGSHNLSHYTLTRSHNLSLLIVDIAIASRILSLYNPLFERARRGPR